jgi:predicted ribosomally synthesized peptide with SipW-like signal peptide
MRDNRILRSLSSTRVRAGLSLGVVAALGVTGTFAYWSDSVTVAGTTFSTGTFDLKVNNQDAVSNASGNLSMSAMAPGNSSAQILTVNNAGNVPLKWTLSAQLTGGSNPGDFATANALKLTVKTGATVSGSGNSATCSGGAVVGTVTTLGTGLSSVVGTPQPTTAGSGLAGGANTPLCFEVDFDSGAPTSLQGKSAVVTFTFDATSNLA